MSGTGPDGVIILPEREGFGKSCFGAISLTVYDNCLHGRFSCAVISGVVQAGFAGADYRPVRPAKRWYESNTRAYARAVCAEINTLSPRFAEVHNRPGLFFRLRKRLAIPLMFYMHNDPHGMRELRTPQARARLLREADAVLCVSRWVRARLLDGVPEALHARAHVVPNGFAPVAGMGAKEKLIAFAGRLTPEKGADILARALAIALPQLPEWRAVLAGGRRHSKSRVASPYEQEIARILEPVHTQAELPGFCAHETVLEHFARASVVVVPSRWQEPFGRTALEAMAHGAAVITSGTGGLAEVVEEAGITYPPEDAEALAAHIIDLAREPARLHALQNAARAQASRYSIEASAAALDAVRDALL